MTKLTKTDAAAALPASHLIALDRMGFKVVSYLNESAKVVTPDGDSRTEWLPALAVAPSKHSSGYRVIQWLPKGHPLNAYSFSGWQTHDGHSCGGMYKTIGQALAWFKWHDAQRSPENGQPETKC